MWRILAVTCVAVCLSACRHEDESRVEEFNLRPVTLPDRTVIQTEVMTRQADMARGMMYRDTFPEGRGMLFIHGSPNRYPYWMYQTRVPLDIVWMDRMGKIVEISENTPPCKGASSTCPNYGGSKEAMVVLEIPGGYGRKHGIVVGDVIRF